MDKLNLIRIFLAVVDHGNFVNAATALELSPSAVSKAITRLEQELEINLIHRTTRNITLTQSGQCYAKSARSMILELEACELELQQNNQAPKGRLKINLPLSYGRHYVTPTIEKFTKKYPEITLQLTFDDSYVDMLEHGIDLTIRSGTLDDSSFIAKQLSPMDFLICASPKYLKHNPDVHPDNYHKHTWIRFRFRQTGQVMPILVQKGNRIIKTDPNRDIVVDDGESMSMLCADGAGLMQVPHFGARKWLHANKLKVIAPYVRPKEFGIWMIYPKRNFTPAKTTCFMQYFENEIRNMGETPTSTWAEDYTAFYAP